MASIRQAGYHNHRRDDHSDIVSEGVFRSLAEACQPLARDVEEETINHWLNVRTPGARERRIDLMVGEVRPGTANPDIKKFRLCMENKSVVTAHRNRDARFDDLNEVLSVLHRVKPEGIVLATIMVGVSPRHLNIPDKVKAFYRGKPQEFEQRIRPRLSAGDESLWSEFDWAISTNRPADPQQTVAKFRKLPTRPPGRTDVAGFDFIYIVPVLIDNVGLPQIARRNSLGIDVDGDYDRMIATVCKAYTARWHW